jgi:hypothetical protein
MAKAEAHDRAREWLRRGCNERADEHGEQRGQPAAPARPPREGLASQ